MLPAHLRPAVAAENLADLADLPDLAAWTVVANVILNLDESFMCP